MIKAVIFDLDNTIYDFDSCEANAYSAVFNLVCNKFGVSANSVEDAFKAGKSRIKRQLGHVASSHNRLLYFQATLEELNLNPVTAALEMYELFWNTILDRIKPYPGIIDLCQDIKAKKKKIAICTNLTADIQIRKIDKLKISNFIDMLITSEEAGVEKPNPAIFNLCLDKLDMRPSDCLFVGDSQIEDIDGALAVGMKAVLFSGRNFNLDYY